MRRGKSKRSGMSRLEGLPDLGDEEET